MKLAYAYHRQLGSGHFYECCWHRRNNILPIPYWFPLLLSFPYTYRGTLDSQWGGRKRKNKPWLLKKDFVGFSFSRPKSSMGLGHKQPPTPMQTDNSCAEGVINNKIQPKRTKAMDMRFHWLRDRQCQEQFRIYWKPGKLNYADYWTKHHAAKHHQAVRPEFIRSQRILDTFKHSNIEGAMLVTALARVWWSGRIPTQVRPANAGLKSKSRRTWHLHQQ